MGARDMDRPWIQTVVNASVEGAGVQWPLAAEIRENVFALPQLEAKVFGCSPVVAVSGIWSLLFARPS